MARCVLSLVALSCLGLAFLHMVSAETREEEGKDLEAALSSQVEDAKLEDIQIQQLREADAKKKTKRRKGKRKSKKGKGKKKKGKRARKSKKGKRKSKKGKRKSKKGKRKSKKGKRKSRKGKKRTKKNKKNSKKQRNMGGLRTDAKNSTCDVKGLCQKIKDYIKYSNQLRKLKRINKTCTTMDKKRSKADGGEFNATADAVADSGNDTVNKLAEELKKCRATAKSNCETNTIAACKNITLNQKCLNQLSKWIAKFGPAKGSCLQSSADCCKCINDIKPEPSADCLNFEALDDDSKAKKKKCTGSGTKGSFGYCRKLQQDLSHKGPKAHKKKCKNKGKMSTKASGKGRKRINVRSKLLDLVN